ncbi:MAG TPA: hypothetical protein VJP85_07360 [Candidatus Baltobacteraceae bacterium]|nr:hypothetical protein [Candidatus Baltobacteraceae bacterium]
MPYEIINTVAAVGTFLVIAATAIAAVIQLRHMRVNNQLEGLLSVLARVEDPSFNRWMTEAKQQLPAMLADPAYRRSIMEDTYDREVSWLFLGNSYDWVGSLVKNRLIPEDALMDVYGFRVIRAWDALSDVLAILRRTRGPGIWENFEYLYTRANAWWERNRDGGLPKSFKRVKIEDPWLLDDLAFIEKPQTLT